MLYHETFQFWHETFKIIFSDTLLLCPFFMYMLKFRFARNTMQNEWINTQSTIKLTDYSLWIAFH